jgi:hypothetical protein
MSIRAAAAFALLGSLAACTSGPGRPPRTFDDAEVEEAGYRDATAFDASPYDGGLDRDYGALVIDGGGRSSFPFSGVFGILNSGDPLFAREVNGRLNLVVRDFPYVYTGTIANDGTVDTVSTVLMRSGCAVAKITGRYDRDQAAYVLEHRTCNSGGMPLSSEMMGGFANDFDHSVSGIYELHITVMSNPGNCYGGMNGVLVRYGFNFLPGGAMAIFTAEDVIPTPTWYQGQSGADGSFSATERLGAQDPNPVTSMSGSFTQATANDPVRFSGHRDVWDPLRSCGFSVQLDGVRTVMP